MRSDGRGTAEGGEAGEDRGSGHGRETAEGGEAGEDRGSGHDHATAGSDAAAGVTEDRLDALRREIASVDDALVELIGRRLAAAREIGVLKQSLGRPVLDPAREAEVVRRAGERARDRGIDPEVVRAVLWRIIDSARDVQES